MRRRSIRQAPRWVVGLTGGIATGKTSVLKTLARLGARTISSDDLAHRCIARGRPAYRRIVRSFGRSILRADHAIDRRRLGAVVFRDPQARRRLERLVHPCVIAGLRRFIREHRGFLVLDIPLLFEAGLGPLVDEIWVVDASPGDQVRRLRRRNKLSRAEARLRIQAQWPLSRKRRKADRLLRNHGSLSDLRRRVRSLHRQVDETLRASAQPVR